MAGRFLARWVTKGIFRKLAEKVVKWRSELYVLYLVVRHQRTPLLPKLFCALIVGYAFSPVDLVPDFIPVLGYIDDIILVPLGIMLALKLVPADVLADCRRQAALYPLSRKLKIWAAGAVMVLIWLIILGYLFWRFAFA